MVRSLAIMAAAGGVQGECVDNRPGPTPGLELIVDALPWDDCGELQGCHWRHMDPDHRRIRPALYIGALT